MLFNSSLFLFLFLPVALLGFLTFRRFALFELSLFWLVICSLFFYGWWNPVYLLLMGGSIAVNYALGYKQSQLFAKSIRNKPLLGLAVILNLALLAYFKYANFFVDNFTALTMSDFTLPAIILPLAISFFTFQQIAYQVDAYRGETKEYSFLHYCLFVTFFPQLIAGPIVHHKEMMPQFSPVLNAVKEAGSQAQNIAFGLVLLSIGLFKKVIIADNLAHYASPVFDAAEQGRGMTFFEAWGGALAYTFQIYFDFSGYSDMALGIACMFGIMLPLNFFSPYRAFNIVDFWRRWHMTLSRFLRDYVYIPFGGNRGGKISRYRNVLLTMLIGGIWHGAGWTFVLWGALHGLYLMINHGWLACLRAMHVPETVHCNIVYKYVSWGLTFGAVVVAWVFFRAENWQASLEILKGMSGMNGAVLDYRLGDILSFLKNWVTFQGTGIGSFSSLYGLVWIALAAAIALFVPNIYQALKMPQRDGILQIDIKRIKKKYGIILLAVTSLLAVIALSRIGAPSEFLYFDF
jgi:alginate O-acetyltransferase complex protein AlgI